MENSTFNVYQYLLRSFAFMLPFYACFVLILGNTSFTQKMIGAVIAAVGVFIAYDHLVKKGVTDNPKLSPPSQPQPKPVSKSEHLRMKREIIAAIQAKSPDCLDDNYHYCNLASGDNAAILVIQTDGYYQCHLHVSEHVGSQNIYGIYRSYMIKLTDNLPVQIRHNEVIYSHSTPNNPVWFDDPESLPTAERSMKSPHVATADDLTDLFHSLQSMSLESAE